MKFVLIPIEDGNSNMSLCGIGKFDSVYCKKHGAMNQVAEEIKIFRCLGMHNDGECRAGCILTVNEEV